MFTNKSSRCAWLVVVFLLVMLAPSLMAQTAATSALAGTVSDQTGAVAPNVKVTLTSVDTGQVRTTATGADGSYKFGLLPPGTYRVKFEATGFRTAEVPSVTLVVTETETLNQRLEVGSQTQEVTVQGGSVETIQTSNATVGTVMNTQTISGLPLTTRNYTNLLALSTGAATPVFNAATMGKGTQDIAVNGSTTFQNNYQMDGASIITVASHGTAVDATTDGGMGIANPDSIQEFKVQTSLYDAGYGRTPGANVNVVTKSGTNAFHGSAFEFFRNSYLNANDFFRKISPPVGGVPNNGRQVLNQNQYGGAFGGPVKKDKLFFFASYQQTWQKNGVAAAGSSAPTLAPIPTGDRSNTAVFRAALGAVFCPTGTAAGKTSAGGTQVACNGTNINPVALNMLQLKNLDGSYYIPSSSNGGYQSTTFTIPARFTENQAIGNADYVINSSNTVSTRWFYSNDPTNNSFFCGSGSTPGTCLPGAGASALFGQQYGVLRLTSIVTSNLVNEARFSLQRSSTDQSPTTPFTNTQVGIQPLITAPAANTLDEIIVTGAASFTIGTQNGAQATQSKRVTSWEAADQISWSHGKHTIRTGLEIERDRVNWSSPGVADGYESFQTMQDFLLGLPGCSGSLTAAQCTATQASSAGAPLPGQTNGTFSSNIAATGGTTAVTGPSGQIHGFRWGAASGFVQDDFKINPRFTLNLGLRWEYDAVAYDKYGAATNIWPSLLSTVDVPVSQGGTLGSTAATGTLAGFVVPSNFVFAAYPAPPVGGLFVNNKKIPTENTPPIDNFAPRVGFAWQPLANNRLVVRSGFGYFYDRVSLGTYQAGIQAGTPYVTIVYGSGAAVYYATEAQPYGPNPTLGWTPRWASINTATQTGTSSAFQVVNIQPNMPTPLTDEWNLNVQYEFVPSWVLELGYVGSHGIHQDSSSRQLNGALLASPSNPVNGITTDTVGNAVVRVPYLGLAPGGLYNSTFQGDSKFNSLQATVRKTMSHGLSVQAGYTWGKTLSNYNTTTAAIPSVTGGNMNSNNPLDAKQQYGPSLSYRPQRLSVNYSWDLPFGKPEGWKGKLVNGWNVSGVTVAQDGNPLTINDTRGGTVYGFGPGAPVTSRAQFCPGMGPANVGTPGGVEARLGGSVLGGPGYFNAAAFCTTPILGTDGKATGYGNSSVGIILGPGQFNWDIALLKTTQVGGFREGAALQFRAEFFNAFNHTQFNGPAVIDVSKTTTFGQITSASVNPRLLQFALKYVF